MAGGGTAPPLKMGDVLLLIGVSLLIGTLFIQGWDIPTKVKAGDAPLEGNSRTFSGDVLEIEVQTENQSNVRIEVFEDGDEVSDVELFSDESNPASFSYESNGGQLTWKVTLEDDVGGEIDVDLERAYFLNYVPYILGALITTAGVLKKNADEDNKEDPIDAIIEDED
ncbi:MAG: hypothetical protein QGG62_04670 [Candidatus Poseidoniaceae archaeon]|nr:hypothetical protein [Candidatus Poseidoniaceae archaeon]